MTEGRYALIIASYEYEDSGLKKLTAPGQDAVNLARVLEDPIIGGYEVQTLINEPDARLRREIAAFYADRKRDDLLLLYFSGHGVKGENGELYFTASDTDLNLLIASAIPAGYVTDLMRDSRSQRQLLLLDCCYSGAFARGMVARGGPGINTKERFQGRGRIILTASDEMQYAWEQEQPQSLQDDPPLSIFTHWLVRGLETGEADTAGDGPITANELYGYVYQHVTEQVAHQRPRSWGLDVEGELVLAQNPNPVEQPSESDEDITATISNLEVLARSDDKEVAAKAREMLALLRPADTASAVDSTDEVSTEQLDTPSVEAPAPEPVIPAQVRRPDSPAADTSTSPIGFDWVTIPAGPFWMGSDKSKDKDASGDETPQHEVDLAEFRIARIPVTVEQFSAFVGATEYRTTAEKEGSAYTWTGQKWEDVKGAYWAKPRGPQSDVSEKAKHPVTCISWHDAVAFCEWAGVRLPSEAEWEKAARGTDGQIYPWGNEKPDNKRCNFNMNVKDTTPVGSYAAGAHDLHDMAGNVWEWTSSKFEPYPYDPADGREDPAGVARRVLRGGSFFGSVWFVRCASRNFGFSYYRSSSFGFRVCAPRLLDR